jgi:hypothetical protein
MSLYRFLADHWINNTYFSAGTTAATADVAGGLLPVGWKPSNAVEPLDAAAVNAVYAQKPQLFGLLRSQFGFIASPVTFWKSQPIPGSTAMQFSPTGLGAALAPINA